jgi:hypothetical protein
MSTEIIEREKQFVAQFSEQQHDVLPPEQIQQNPSNKALGGSSKGLNVDDFELVKTLGTGALFFLRVGQEEIGIQECALIILGDRDICKSMASKAEESG